MVRPIPPHNLSEATFLRMKPRNKTSFIIGTETSNLRSIGSRSVAPKKPVSGQLLKLNYTVGVKFIVQILFSQTIVQNFINFVLLMKNTT